MAWGSNPLLSRLPALVAWHGVMRLMPLFLAGLALAGGALSGGLQAHALREPGLLRNRMAVRGHRPRPHLQLSSD